MEGGLLTLGPKRGPNTLVAHPMATQEATQPLKARPYTKLGHNAGQPRSDLTGLFQGDGTGLILLLRPDPPAQA
jgi:hypothetical protein